MSIEKLISAKEVAEILGLSEKTVRAKHKRLGLPHYKVGWLIKYRASESAHKNLERGQIMKMRLAPYPSRERVCRNNPDLELIEALRVCTSPFVCAKCPNLATTPINKKGGL